MYRRNKCNQTVPIGTYKYNDMPWKGAVLKHLKTSEPLKRGTGIVSNTKPLTVLHRKGKNGKEESLQTKEAKG